MGRGRRIIAVTAAASATGAAVGAVCAVAATAVVLPLWGGRPDLYALRLAGAVGAAVGAVAAPLVAWGLLRHVPLGRAIGHGALGTLVGALVGWAAGPVGVLAGAVLGFGAAALRLRLVARREGSRQLPPEGPAV